MAINNSQVVKRQGSTSLTSKSTTEHEPKTVQPCPILTAWHLSVMLPNLSFRSPGSHNILSACISCCLYLKIPSDSLPYQHFIPYTRPYFIPHIFLSALLETFVIYVLSLIARHQIPQQHNTHIETRYLSRYGDQRAGRPEFDSW
jgi:hypothetical protein